VKISEGDHVAKDVPGDFETTPIVGVISTSDDDG
jgi:hypothetical protein